MSNTQVGNVYQQIIADVVDSSRVDFEEGGVDESVLEELRKGWQQKLSQLQVATFPWDPKPDPPAPITNPPTVPSNAAGYQNMGSIPVTQANPMPPMPSMNNSNNGPRIKTEPGMENQNHNMTPAPYQNPVMPLPNATTAQQRAAQNLQAAYGQRAAASIDSIRGGAAPPQPQQNMPQNMQHQQAMHHQQAQQQMQHQQMQQQRPANAMPPQQQQQARPSQPEIAYSQAMAAQAAQMQQSAMHSRNGQPPQNGPNGQYTQNGHGGQNPQGGVGGAQTDGTGDDSEESIGVIKQFDSEGNEIAMGRIDIDNLIRGKIESMGKAMEGGGLMLPLKEATKTKNRSHGVLTVNGKEYVFHKASGEYEW
ncbi:hypothetical protein CJF30_00005408 [Rutstroemia sp. NJR-2017a BBW]|nr:hypothetical protein CJF30_00005408 [Rutstroemia sp. NJR-2017a BBW]